MCLPALAALLAVSPAPAQTVAQNSVRHDVALLAEPLAAGVQYVIHSGGGLRFGAALVAGPQFGVDVANSRSDIRAWASVNPVLGYRFSNGAEFFISPIGASAIIGNDFGAIYPSGQAGAEFGVGPLRFASLIRTIRIAGGNGTGTYWTQWLPLRVGIPFGGRGRR
jgi:hypothetical protein